MPKPRPPAQPPSPAAMMRALEILHGLHQQLTAIDPTIPEDDKLYADMLEGEGGDALELLANVVRVSIEADDLAEAAKLRKQRIGERQSRFEKRRDAMRRSVFSALQALDLRRWEQPDFSVFISKGRDKVIITDETKLADEFVHITQTPDKDAISVALAANQPVTGAERGNAEPYLTVRSR